MTPERDYNGLWRLEGHHQHVFSTEADAKAAAELAQKYADDLLSRAMSQESRYRRAEQRAKEQA